MYSHVHKVHVQPSLPLGHWCRNQVELVSPKIGNSFICPTQKLYHGVEKSDTEGSMFCTTVL